MAVCVHLTAVTPAVQMSPIIRAVEPAACPSLTKGTYTYDYGDTAGAFGGLQVAGHEL
jgi:predicted alternative tryptophan synthase beta-subunit